MSHVGAPITLRRWRDVVAGITCTSLPWRLQLSCDRLDEKLRIRVGSWVPDARQPVNQIMIYMDEFISIETASRMSDAHVVSLVNRLVHQFAAHEVDEAFCVNGERWHDPHAGEKQPQQTEPRKETRP